MKSRALLLVTIVCLLAGCTSLPLAPGCLRLGRNGQFCPLPPAALPALNGTRLVSVTRQGQTQTFLGRLQIDAQNLRLAGLSLFGTELFTLDYDGSHIASHPAQGELHPELLLAMLELTLAPAAELPPRLTGLTLTVSSAGGQQIRELWESGYLLARIEESVGAPAGAAIHMVIPPAGLALQLTPLADGGDSK